MEGKAFQGKTTAMVHKAILDQTPTPPTQLNAQLPEQADAIISKALEKDRELLYQSASELRTDLRRKERLRIRPANFGQTRQNHPDKEGILAAVGTDDARDFSYRFDHRVNAKGSRAASKKVGPDYKQWSP